MSLSSDIISCPVADLICTLHYLCGTVHMLLPVYLSPGKGGMPFLFTWYYLVLLWARYLKTK
jgi:hypothetical protein